MKDLFCATCKAIERETTDDYEKGKVNFCKKCGNRLELITNVNGKNYNQEGR